MAPAFRWCLFDWANTAFSTVIVTFVYSVYFQNSIVGDKALGSALWAYALAASGFIAAVLGPVVGATVDHYGRRRLFLRLFTFISVAAIALMAMGAPHGDNATIFGVLALLVIAGAANELGIVINNAILPHITGWDRLGRMSGWAWGMGYLGGLTCLVIALFGFIGIGQMQPWFPLPTAQGENIRAVALLAAVWYLVFSLPLLLWRGDMAGTGLKLRTAVATGLAELGSTLRDARRHPNLVLFLLASAIYRDGMNTLFAVGGLYASGTFGMDFQEILIFAIGLNVTAGLGAALFAFADDRLGSKPTVLVSLVGLCVFGAGVLVVQDKTAFLVLALCMGVFVGPVQAASRTMAARLSPPDRIAQTYGLYALTGKSIAFLGPLAFATLARAFDSQRIGMSSILIFWIVGFFLLLLVKERKS